MEACSNVPAASRTAKANEKRLLIKERQKASVQKLHQRQKEFLDKEDPMVIDKKYEIFEKFEPVFRNMKVCNEIMEVCLFKPPDNLSEARICMDKCLIRNEKHLCIIQSSHFLFGAPIYSALCVGSNISVQDVFVFIQNGFNVKPGFSAGHGGKNHPYLTRLTHRYKLREYITIVQKEIFNYMHLSNFELKSVKKSLSKALELTSFTKILVDMVYTKKNEYEGHHCVLAKVNNSTYFFNNNSVYSKKVPMIVTNFVLEDFLEDQNATWPQELVAFKLFIYVKDAIKD
jgi:hypothetical protein